jgi:pimeloyl-ACP methyl ester carboxylesterase
MKALRMARLRLYAAGILWTFLVAIASVAPARGQGCTDLPPGRGVSDGGGGCLALVPAGGTGTAGRAPPRVLVVMMHGDGGGALEQRHVDSWLRVGRTLQAKDRHVVLLIRPGYQTPAGSSSGWANPRDDDYTAANIARVAGALAALRRTSNPRHIVLIGHSGGAATAALVLGRHPGVADAALLLGCPCDVPPWRSHRNSQRGAVDRPWGNSLNPISFVSAIPQGTPVIAATGVEDDNTLPRFARRWVELASAKGVDARYEDVPGHGHGSILRWDGIAHHLQALIAALPQETSAR